MYRYILFDLDGTLTDSSLGITESVRQALLTSGYDAPAATELNWVVGPSLRESFAKLAQTDDKSVIEQLMANYRQRFEPIGMFENKVYPAVPNTLQTLIDQGFALFVATSKPRVYAERILEHFQLRPFFQAIAGAELDGSIESKADVIRSLLQTHNLRASECIMIGDREHDIRGAQQTGMDSIGVTYGFGSAAELKDADASFIVHRPQDIVDVVVGKRGQ